MPVARSTTQDRITKTARASENPNTHVHHRLTIVHKERQLARNQGRDMWLAPTRIKDPVRTAQ